MALQSSGKISISDINNEFGKNGISKLSGYFGICSNIPISGKISLSDFYGKTKDIVKKIITHLDIGCSGYANRIDSGKNNITYMNLKSDDDFTEDIRQKYAGITYNNNIYYGDTTFVNNIDYWGISDDSELTVTVSKMAWTDDDAEQKIWIYTSENGQPSDTSTKLFALIEFSAISTYYKNTYKVTEYGLDGSTNILYNKVDWYFGKYAAASFGKYKFYPEKMEYTATNTYGLPSHTINFSRTLPEYFYMVVWGRAYGTYSSGGQAISALWIDNTFIDTNTEIAIDSIIVSKIINYITYDTGTIYKSFNLGIGKYKFIVPVDNKFNYDLEYTWNFISGVYSIESINDNIIELNFVEENEHLIELVVVEKYSKIEISKNTYSIIIALAPVENVNSSFSHYSNSASVSGSFTPDKSITSVSIQYVKE